jgi:hypothetical protein
MKTKQAESLFNLRMGRFYADPGFYKNWPYSMNKKIQRNFFTSVTTDFVAGG